jgi:dTMP kinase
LDLETVNEINNAATHGLEPDLTVLLDTDVETGLARKGARKQDRFEREVLDFHQRVRAGYLEMAGKEPERWLVVNANQSKEKIQSIVWQRVSQLLSERVGV